MLHTLYNVFNTKNKCSLAIYYQFYNNNNTVALQTNINY